MTLQIGTVHGSQPCQTHREMSYKAAFWQQKEINHHLTRTFLIEGLVAMNTAFALCPWSVIFSSFRIPRSREYRRGREKNLAEHLARELSQRNYYLIVGSGLPGKWCLKRSAQRDDVAFSSCENLLYPLMRRTGNIRKDGICVHSSVAT